MNPRAHPASGWANGHLLNCDPSNLNPSSVISGGCLNAPLVNFGIYGLIIVLVMLFRPYGVFPERRRKVEFEIARDGKHEKRTVSLAAYL